MGAKKTSGLAVTKPPILGVKTGVMSMPELSSAGPAWASKTARTEQSLRFAQRRYPIRDSRRKEAEMIRAVRLRKVALILVAAVLSLSGCTSPVDYLRNGFKVGPNLGVPAGATAPHWIDEGDIRVRDDCASGTVVDLVPGPGAQPVDSQRLLAEPVLARSGLPGAGGAGAASGHPRRSLPAKANRRRSTSARPPAW